MSRSAAALLLALALAGCAEDGVYLNVRTNDSRTLCGDALEHPPLLGEVTFGDFITALQGPAHRGQYSAKMDITERWERDESGRVEKTTRGCIWKDDKREWGAKEAFE